MDDLCASRADAWNNRASGNQTVASDAGQTSSDIVDWCCATIALAGLGAIVAREEAVSYHRRVLAIAAQMYRLDPDLLAAIAQVESNGNPDCRFIEGRARFDAADARDGIAIWRKRSV